MKDVKFYGDCVDCGKSDWEPIEEIDHMGFTDEIEAIEYVFRCVCGSKESLFISLDSEYDKEYSLEKRGEL